MKLAAIILSFEVLRASASNIHNDALETVVSSIKSEQEAEINAAGRFFGGICEGTRAFLRRSNTSCGKDGWKEVHTDIAHGPFVPGTGIHAIPVSTVTPASRQNGSAEVEDIPSAKSALEEVKSGEAAIGGWREHHVELAHGPWGRARATLVNNKADLPDTKKGKSSTKAKRHDDKAAAKPSEVDAKDWTEEGLDEDLFEQLDHKLRHHNNDGEQVERIERGHHICREDVVEALHEMEEADIE